MSYAPPSKIYTITTEGKLSRPYTYNYIREYEPALMQTVFKQDRSKKYYIDKLVEKCYTIYQTWGRLRWRKCMLP